jgi:hypothetical protein
VEENAFVGVDAVVGGQLPGIEMADGGDEEVQTIFVNLRID